MGVQLKLFINSWAWVCPTLCSPWALLKKRFKCGFGTPDSFWGLSLFNQTPLCMPQRPLSVNLPAFIPSAI